MRRLPAALVIASSFALAQRSPVRELELHLADGWYVATDSGDEKTALRFRATDQPNVQCSLNGAALLSWHQPAQLEFESSEGRTFERRTAPTGQYVTWVRGPERAELQLAGTCTELPGRTRFTLECDALRLSIPMLEGFLPPPAPGLFSAASGVRSADGGVLLFANGAVREWRGDHWDPVAPLPFAISSVAPASERELVAIGRNDAGVESTWVLSDQQWTEAGARGLSGKIVAPVEGSPWLLSGNTAFSWNSTRWEPRAWPVGIRLEEAVASRDGGFWGISVDTGSFVHVTPPAEVVTLGESASLQLVAMRGRVPAAVDERGFAEWMGPDAGWTVVSPFDFAPSGKLATVASDARGRAFVVLVGFPVSASEPKTFIYDPWRSLGARCAWADQCESGACADGRCVSNAPAVSEITPPAGCGCASNEGLLVLLALMLSRRASQYGRWPT